MPKILSPYATWAYSWIRGRSITSIRSTLFDEGFTMGKARGLELVAKLAYIWTDSGEICFEAGATPRKLTLRFHIVNKLHMFNALNEAMLQEPERINWGISEIAKFVVDAARDSDDFAQAEFVWEWDRRILVWFRAITIELADPVDHS